MIDAGAARQLIEGDQLVLAALLRLLVRLDGKFSGEEQEALEDLASEFGEKSFWQLMDEAGLKLPDEATIHAAIDKVDSPDARELIYSLILRVAQSDCIQGREQGLLDALRKSWQLDEQGSPYR